MGLLVDNQRKDSVGSREVKQPEKLFKVSNMEKKKSEIETVTPDKIKVTVKQ